MRRVTVVEASWWHPVRATSITVTQRLLLLGLAAGLAGCPDHPPCEPPELEAKLRAELKAVHARYPGNPGWLLSVKLPERGLDFQGAIGEDPATGQALEPAATFRIASVTKTFTAAAILRLVEEEQLGLDEPIASLLPAPYPSMLTEGGYQPAAITVRHLLTHTGGLFDYARSEAYQQAVFSDPSHRWSREEQVRFAMEHGSPAGQPGELYSYSDTAYILLGAILERKTGKDLGAALRSLDRFAALGLSATWLETLEPVPPGAPGRAPQTLLGIPLEQFDASIDLWGAGGLVSTTRELEAFYRAIFEGRVYARPGTLPVMLTLPATNTSQGAAMGIFQESVDETRCWNHDGIWGASAAFCPELGLGLATTGLAAEQLGAGVTELRLSVIRAVRDCRR